jgi:hypothetical protein
MRVRTISLTALAIWPVFLIMAVMLGAIREGIIAPTLGDQAAHVIGTLLFVAAMLVIQWVFVSRIRERVQPRELWWIGLMWTAMTVTFEFGFFHFVAGVAWEQLIADYNIFAGRLWLLVLLATLGGPRLIFAAQQRGRHDRENR